MLFLPLFMLIWDILPPGIVLFYYVKLPFDRCVTAIRSPRCLFWFYFFFLFFFSFCCCFICVTERARCLSCEAVRSSSLASTVVRNVLALPFFLTQPWEPNTTWVVIKAAGCCLQLLLLLQTFSCLLWVTGPSHVWDYTPCFCFERHY